MVLHFRNILIGNQSDELAVGIDYGQLLDFVAQQNVGRTLQVGVVSGHQPLLGHHLVDLAVHIALEPQIAVGHDADQMLIRSHDGNTADLVLLHQCQRIAYGIVLGNSDRVVDHTVFGTLHLPHVSRLLGNRHILVNYADTAFAGQGDSQRRLGHRIHGGRYDRDVELDVSGKTGHYADLTRQHFGVCGHQKHIVERKSFGLHLLIDKRHRSEILLPAKVIIIFGLFFVHAPNFQKIGSTARKTSLQQGDRFKITGIKPPRRCRSVLFASGERGFGIQVSPFSKNNSRMKFYYNSIV